MAYSKVAIAIPEVTGDIVINVTTEAAVAAYTNQIPISTDTDGSIFNGVGYKQGYRLNSSGYVADIGSGITPTEWFVTGFIPVKGGDVIRFSGAYVEGNLGGLNNFYYDSSKVKGSLVFSPNSFSDHLTSTRTLFKDCNYNENEQRLYSFTLKDTVEAGYMRFTLHGNGANAVVTVNEEIV